jgi:DNA ligase 1
MEFIWPMLLNATDPFSSSKYIYQWKADGIRLELLYKRGKGVTCYTRHKTNCSTQFIELQEFHADADIILDGEIICMDQETGRESLDMVMERFHLRNEDKIRYAALYQPCVYLVFDILYYKEPLIHLNLMERLNILGSSFEDTQHIKKMTYIDGAGEDFFENVKGLKLEGMVAKLKEKSPYLPGKRTSNFLKVIRYEYFDNIVITGYRKKKFGLLCSFITADGRYSPAGVIEFIGPVPRKLIFKKALNSVVAEDRLNVYIKKEIVCKVKTRGITKNGYLRSPVFVDFVSPSFSILT